MINKGQADFIFSKENLFIQIKNEYDVWDFDKAYNISKQIEFQNLTSEQSLKPSDLILLVNTKLSYFKKNELLSANNLLEIEKLLTLADSILTKKDIALADEVHALQEYLQYLRNRDHQIQNSAKQSNPFKIRILCAIYLEQNRFSDIIAIIDKYGLDEKWCDLAVLAYTLAGQFEKARSAIQWATKLSNKSLYLQSCVHYANATLSWISQHHQKQQLFPHEIAIQDQKHLNDALEVLFPILGIIRIAGHPSSGLDIAALKAALQINYLLQNGKNVANTLHLMVQKVPIPLEVATGVISGVMEATSDLPDRLRKEHEGNFKAGVMAVTIEFDSLDKPIDAFRNARELLPLADQLDKKQELFPLFFQLWQCLGPPEKQECAALIEQLVSDNPFLNSIYTAAVALQNKDADTAIRILDESKAEEDLLWLQIRANAALQKQHVPEAVDYLFTAAKRTLNPSLLFKCAETALKAGMNDTAIWCLYELTEIKPDAIQPRTMLAHIYTGITPDLDKAVVQFRELHRIEPENQDFTYNLALCHAQLFNIEKSLQLFKELCEANPPLPALLSLSRIYISLGNPENAHESLERYRQKFWGDASFLLEYMSAAFAAGKENSAVEALGALRTLEHSGSTDEPILQMFPEDKALEEIKKRFNQSRVMDEDLHSMMLKGHMPWVWAEHVTGKAVYWGWRMRTQEMLSIGDAPINQSHYTIYATNTFHPLFSDDGKRSLQLITCPEKGADIVIDISALITLHRLGLLGELVDYFQHIFVPAGYLPMVLEDGRRLVLHQRSKKTYANNIIKLVTAKRIKTVPDECSEGVTLALVDEYADANEHQYRLIDVLHPLYDEGLLSEPQFEHVSALCSKLSAIDDKHPPLQRYQEIQVGVQSLETLAGFELLDIVAEFFQIRIASAAHYELISTLESIHIQEEVHAWQLDLWKTLRSDERFIFIPHVVPEKIRDKVDPSDDFISLMGNFIAEERKIPLLCDDRINQAFALNGEAAHPDTAFGTNAFIMALYESGILNIERVITYIHTLIQWRYRFLSIKPEILKHMADDYRTHPPGSLLRDVSVYVHDCMRDSGLFGGPENTETKESMASRFFLSWITSIAEFLVLIWADEKYSVEAATEMTNWACEEFLPEAPKVLNTPIRERFAQRIQQTFIAHVLIKAAQQAPERMAIAGKAIKESLHLDDERFQAIVLEILDVHSIHSSRSDSSIQEGLRVLQIVMRNIAFQQFTYIGPRSITMLKELQLSGEVQEPPGSDFELEILQDIRHPRRVSLPPGSLLIYRSLDEKPELIATDIPVLLMSDEVETRKAALKNLVELSTGSENFFTVKTAAILKETQAAIETEDPHEWRRASIVLYDALNDDLLLSLQTIRQCLKFGSGLKDYTKTIALRMLYPTRMSFDSFSLAIRNPDTDQGQMKRIVQDAVLQASGLIDACSLYYDQLGHLPLARPYTLGDVVKLWMEKNPGCDPWVEVWDWAKQEQGPIPSYHGCVVFVEHPYLIPEGKKPELWDRIISVLRTDDGIGKNLDQEPWLLRRDLVRHFSYHLETLLPERDGGAIANLSWWLAERVALLFPDNPESARFYREKWVSAPLRQSERIWLTSSPRMGKSFLRYITRIIKNPWATALLSLMGENIEQLVPQEQNEAVQQAFTEALISSTLGALSSYGNTPSDPVYAQEYPLVQMLRKWASKQQNDVQQELMALTEASIKLDSKEELRDSLEKLDKSSLPDQIAVAIALKAKAYTDSEIQDYIWKVISDRAWRQRVLTTIEVGVLSMLIEALTIFQTQYQGDWFFQLPHYVAELCEIVTDEERQQLFFQCVILTSLISETTSAINRLLHGENKMKFSTKAAEYCTTLKKTLHQYPAWIQGKLRALFAVI